VPMQCVITMSESDVYQSLLMCHVSFIQTCLLPYFFKYLCTGLSLSSHMANSPYCMCTPLTINVHISVLVYICIFSL
jgi:hypothetical protein